MSGRKLILIFAAFLVVFAAVLAWFQLYAFYEHQEGVGAVTINGEVVPVADYDGIDSTSSPLKLRGCFRIDPAMIQGAEPAPDATPLNAPFWFGCFDAGQLSDDLGAGEASAWRIAEDDPDGFDLMLAAYPDGRGYIWRQLNERFQ